MIYAYIFEPNAAKEYEETLIWYEERSILAADNFIIAVQEGIKQACSDPFRYRNLYSNLREITLRKYPFNLIYYVNESKMEIVIVSVFHHKRNPKNKYRE